MRPLRSLGVAAIVLAAPMAGTGHAEDSGRWKEVARAFGDLTGDGVPDLVVLRKLDDRSNVLANESLGPPRLDTNPRELVVLASKAGGYRRIASTRNLIPPEADADVPCLADPLEEGGLAVEKGLLVIRMQYWLSCGSYGVTDRTLKFRFENGRFRLIGYDRLEFSRASGVGEETSINYLTGRRKVTTGIAVIEPEDGGPRPKREESWSRIDAAPTYLDTMDRASCDDWDNAPSWC